MMAAAQKLSGYGSIALFLAEHVGVEFTVASVRAYASRTKDPLPVRAFGDRIVADADAVGQWVARQWRDKGTWKNRSAG